MDERVAMSETNQPAAMSVQMPKAVDPDRQRRARLLRSLDPTMQPPPPGDGKQFEKGKTYWIINTDDLDHPRRGKIVRLTRTPGKYIGVEFAEPVGPHIVHDCDGAGKPGHCLYCRPDQVLTDEEYSTYVERVRAALARAKPPEDLDTLRIAVDEQGNTVVQ
jgi:hypothetical protein